MPVADFYREDLAYIHDAGYGGVARDAADRLLRELAGAGLRDGTVADLGCGSGLLAQRVATAGYRLIGIDLSDAMVALARARVPGGQFQVESILSADLPRSVAVAAIGEVLNYCADPANDDRARNGFFRRAYDALVPGGCLLFDVAGPARAAPGGPHRTFAEGRDWAVLVETEKSTAPALLTRRITTFRQVGALYRRNTEVHQIALLDPVEVLERLRAVGFKAQSIASYGPETLPPGVVAFLCRKPITVAGA
jgi:SAM-dependent methyltransferase